MGKLFERLCKEGITWPQFFFQVVIVLMGVYLAVLSERKAEERNLREDTDVMLQNVIAELNADEEEILRILQLQEVRLEVVQELSEILSTASQADAPRVDSLFTRYLDNNRTAFVRKSTYDAMVAGGYLRSLVRTEIPVQFASLYERTYARVSIVGDWQDFHTFEYLLPAYLEHYDEGGHHFIKPGPEANVRFRNAALRLVRSIPFYSGFLETTLDEIRAVRGTVEEYLESS